MSEKEKNVGVILCDCGGEISKLLDFNQLAEFTSKLQGVKSVRKHSSLCNGEGKTEIINMISEGVDRLVIAACSPKLYEMHFRNWLVEAGLNPYCLEMANIREHCAWPHFDSPELANEKAKRLVAAAVGKALRSMPIEEKEFSINDSVLVIGAGAAGIRAAVDIADFGHEVYLIEKAPIIGGNALKLGLAFPTDDGAFCISSPNLLTRIRKCFYRASLLQHPRIKLFTLSQIKEVDGSFGDFEVKIVSKPRGVSEELCINCGKCGEACPVDVPDEMNYGFSKRKAIYLPHPNAVPPVWVIDWENCNKCGKCLEICPTRAIDLSDEEEERTLRVGSIIVSTGLQEYNPAEIKQYKYGLYRDVITQLQLARILDPFGPTNGKMIRPSTGTMPKSIVMIQCVGSRDENTNPYCSKICCTFALKHAIHIKEKIDPNIDVYICYIDIRTPMGYEEMYLKARELGVKFIRGKPSEIHKNSNEENMIVEVEDTLINRPIEIESDLVVLSTALTPSSGTEKLAEILGIEAGEYGFVKEVYSKLKPIETNVKGIYVCGGAQGPKDIPESVTQADAAAYQTILNLSGKKVKRKMDIAFVDQDKCDGCEICVEVCPYSAIHMVEAREKNPVNLVAVIDEALCERCGSCASRCPTGAIQLSHYTDSQFLGQIAELLSGGSVLNPKVVAFCCDECGYATVDLIGMGRKSYPTEVLPVRVPCLGWVSLYHIFKTFEYGADGILLVGCLPEKCQNLKGDLYAKRVLSFARNILDEIGLNGKRLRMASVCAATPEVFIKEAEILVKDLKELGPIMRIKEGE